EFAVSLTFFLLGLTTSGMVSLGSIFAAIALPSSLLFRQYVLKHDIQGFNFLIFFFTALSILVIYTHRANIRRIMEGTENRFPKFQIFKRKV
ncbi:MAG: glycerol-3-phosphate acyltransferase, partial [Bacteroidota bacterium]